MEKITVRELFRALKKHLVYVLLPGLILGFLAYFLTGRKKGVEYKAQAILMIVPEKEEELTYNKMMQNEKLASIYSSILDSDDIYKRVVKDKGLEESYRTLKDSLSSEVSSQGGIISLEYTARSSEKAADYLTYICEEYRNFVKEYTNMDNLAYLQEVSEPENPKKKAVGFGIGGLIVGIFLGILFVLIREINSEKIKDKDYLEELGLEFLGEIDEG